MKRAWISVLLVAAACFSKPQPNCAFLCGTSGECPVDYMCVTADNRCHLIVSGTPAMCDDTLPADAAVAPPDAMADASPDAMNSLTSVSVTPAQLVAGASGTVTIAFTTSNPWPSDGQVVVDMTSLYDASSVTFVSKNANVDGTVTAMKGTANRIIVLKRSGGTTIAGSTPVSIVVGNVANPPVSGSQPMPTVTTENVSGGPIDSFMPAGATITPGALTALMTTLSDTTTAHTPNVTVNFTVANPWPSDGVLTVQFPAVFDPAGANTVTSSTGTGLTGNGTVGVTSVVGQLVTLTRTGATAGTTATGALSITFGMVTNPAANTYQPFVITTETGAGTAIDTGSDTTGVTVTP
jgi:hypothetical protein